jgi:16S rRNA (cytosine967-C5)-methyltransferase
MTLAPGVLGRLPAALSAQVQVQDEGAQAVARAVSARPGERVLDVCAAPGGKTLVLAADMRAAGAAPVEGLLVAGDFRASRVALLAKTMARGGVPVKVVRYDARQPLPFRPVFDAVVLDAPCSGLGTLRRDPDLKWTRTEADLPVLAAAERRMLEAAALVVRPGGRLIYATCSSEPEENEAVVDAFMATSPGVVPLAIRLPDERGAELVDARGHLVTLPFRDGLDAFFAAAFVRRDAT